MDEKRINRIARLLQKELSDLFLKQTKEMPGTLVSVSIVRVSPDLSIAKAYLSIFPSEKAEEMLSAIEMNSKTIRYDLGQRVRNQLRKIPELSFYLDDSLDYVEHIDKLLKSNNV
ncbi:MAG: 30S ribosome-binding factor RbfA [Tannerella sp.]|jgi:ribosome-binding factor A|nr:30S ribosome-binding factor RbfA [Tannerella sp.]